VGAQVVLLRGINIGPRNRIAMPALREALSDAGYEEVRTYVQSGNVVLGSDQDERQLVDRVQRLIKVNFDLDIAVIVRTRAELAKVVQRNPLGALADNPKRYQVSFLAAKPDAATVRRLTEYKAPSEELAASGRELYAWHPDGVARSKLWAALADKRLGTPATARNWTTVTTLLRMANECATT
jgi:uncharacterized protein (DUF1697 family)